MIDDELVEEMPLAFLRERDIAHGVAGARRIEASWWWERVPERVTTVRPFLVSPKVTLSFASISSSKADVSQLSSSNRRAVSFAHPGWSHG